MCTKPTLSEFCLHPQLVEDVVVDLLCSDIISKDKIEELKGNSPSSNNLDPNILMDLRHGTANKKNKTNIDNNQETATTSLKRAKKDVITSKIKDLKSIDEEIAKTRRNLNIFQSQLKRENSILANSINSLEKVSELGVTDKNGSLVKNKTDCFEKEADNRKSPSIVNLDEFEVKHYFDLHLDHLEESVIKNQSKERNKTWKPISMASPPIIQITTSVKNTGCKQSQSPLQKSEFKITESNENIPIIVKGKTLSSLPLKQNIKQSSVVPNNSPDSSLCNSFEGVGDQYVYLKEKEIIVKVMNSWKQYVKNKKIQRFSKKVELQTNKVLLKRVFRCWSHYVMHRLEIKQCKTDLHSKQSLMLGKSGILLPNEIKSQDLLKKLDVSAISPVKQSNGPLLDSERIPIEIKNNISVKEVETTCNTSANNELVVDNNSSKTYNETNTISTKEIEATSNFSANNNSLTVNNGSKTRNECQSTKEQSAGSNITGNDIIEPVSETGGLMAKRTINNCNSLLNSEESTVSQAKNVKIHFISKAYQNGTITTANQVWPDGLIIVSPKNQNNSNTTNSVPKTYPIEVATRSQANQNGLIMGPLSNQSGSIKTNSAPQTYPIRAISVPQANISKPIIGPKLCAGVKPITATKTVNSKESTIKHNILHSNNQTGQRVLEENRKDLFAHRYSAQAQVVASQMNLIKQQRQEIIDLKAKILEIESKLKVNTSQRLLAQTSASFSKHLQPGTAVSSNKPAANVERASANKNVLDKSEILTKNLLERQEYCKQLAEKTKLRKILADEERQRLMIKEEIRQKGEKEEQRKLKILKMKLDKKLAEENAKNALELKLKNKELNEKCVLHYKKTLLKKAFLAMKQNCVDVNLRNEECDKFYERKLLRKVLNTWRRESDRSIKTNMNMAEKHYSTQLMVKCWQMWKRVSRFLQMRSKL